jgi:purine-binding chemotaxis protein CheW
VNDEIIQEKTENNSPAFKASIVEQLDVIENQQTYLTFWLENEQYALKASIVREVFTKTEIFMMPMVPEYIQGVINLRGNIIPILDLSLLFFNHPVQITKLTSIIIVEINDKDEQVIVGIMVDDVNEVLKIYETQIEHTPDFGANINIEYISGIVNKESGYIIMLDAEQLFDIDKLSDY